MKRAWMPALLAGVLAAGGCRQFWKDDISPEVEAKASQMDAQLKETRTLTGLAKIEESVKDYVQNEKKIPERLEDLIPQYLADMPTVELGVRGHRDTTRVQKYPSSILSGGQIDGSKIKDTGRWGYVHDERQVVVFVDCVHKSSRGRPWFEERGTN